ncbi:hypothetical protein [Tsukamurella tyrosinosolvens]|uniref:hypothetical protein n=1 Tax=Tsukamurella tyrosinosolvens TaxID=57704 RepID=UPI003461BC76
MTDEQTTTDHRGGADNMVADDHVPDVDNMVDDHPEADPASQTFDAEYVGKLRDEAAKYRTRAKDRDTLAQRLHAALVAADGRLQDPSDLAFAEAHLDGTALQDAITDLVARKPHLAARKVAGDVGQGSRNGTSTVDLLGMLRGH